IFMWTAASDETIAFENMTPGQRFAIYVNVPETSSTYTFTFDGSVWDGFGSFQLGHDAFAFSAVIEFMTYFDDPDTYLRFTRHGAGPIDYVNSGSFGGTSVGLGFGDATISVAEMSLTGDETVSSLQLKNVGVLIVNGDTVDRTLTITTSSTLKTELPSRTIPANTAQQLLFIRENGIVREVLLASPGGSGGGIVTAFPTPGATVTLDCAGGAEMRFIWTPGEDELVQAINFTPGQIVHVMLVSDGSDHNITPDTANGFPVKWTVQMNPSTFDVAPLTNWDTGAATEFLFRADVTGLIPWGPDASSLWGFTP